MHSHKTKKKKAKTKKQKTKQKQKQKPRDYGAATLSSVTVDTFLKTPSPFRNRNQTEGNGKGNGSNAFGLSPPPLARYLQSKADPHLQHQKHFQATEGASKPPQQESQHGSVQFAEESPPCIITQSESGSPLPESLLTVNFLKTPSPRYSSKYRRKLPTRGTIHGSATTTKPPENDDDGVRMLSWAARAVESPALFRRAPSGANHGGTRIAGLGMVDAIECSPICPLPVAAASSPETGAEAVDGGSIGSSPIRSSRRMSAKEVVAASCGTSNAASEATSDGDENSVVGPSPLCFRNHHRTESELELLRNCLEDVFATN